MSRATTILITPSDANLSELDSAARNTTIRCKHENRPETWFDAIGEVRKISDEFTNAGLTVAQVRFYNEVNEVTPCNSSRDFFYFTVIGNRQK